MVFISKFLLLFFVLSAKCFASYEKYAAIVVDGKTGNVIHGINETHKRYPASLAKKMTLYLLFEALKEGKINLQTRFLVSKRAAGQAPSKMGIPAGQTISVEHIIKSLVVKSANDIAVAAAEGLFGSVERFAVQMTQKAKELGMNNTVFKNPSGVNDAGTTDKSQYTTARDLAILGIALYRDFPQHAHYYKLKTFNYNGRMIHSHNHMLGSVDGLDGIKTGFANAPGFNISTSVVRNDHNNNPQRLFVVVMGGHSWRSRDRHAEELIDYGFKKLNHENQNNAPARIENISVTPYKSTPKIRLLSNRSKVSPNDAIDSIINKKSARKIVKVSYKNTKKRKR